MSFSINTNVASLSAQNYLRISSAFQAQTINRVTSGLRIVQSGDDAAGLAIANGYRSDQSVLTQGVRNANDGLSQLQIMDGGMSNISQLLDRARTLATQSATGTFTGDRSVLNNEFQSVLTEINRQAQAIGLNTNGAFAQNLAVFIGGGKTSGTTTAITNGSETIDLRSSTVDAKSLGLQGVQASANSAVNIGSSSDTSVQKIVNDATGGGNQGSEAVSGYTDFYFKGPGFADGNAVKVSVNLAGVTDANTLATAINSAIQSAGNGTTAASTAFKNSNITASISSPSGSTSQYLTFTSGSAAFEVQAGDKTSNALLGNLAVAGAPTGASLTTTFAGANNLQNVTTTLATQNTTVKLRFQGANLTAPEDISVAVTAGQTLSTVLANLNTAIAADGNLGKAGISVTQQSAASPLQFSSTKGGQFSVTAGGDVENLLGLGSARLDANSASGNVDYTTIAGAVAYSQTTTAGTANFQISLNGAAPPTTVSVALNGGNATSGKVTGVPSSATYDTSANNVLDLAVDGTAYHLTLGTAVAAASNATATVGNIVADLNQQFQTNSIGATASIDGTGHLTITSNAKGVGSSVQILTASATDAGATLFTGSTLGTGSNRDANDVANYLNSQFAANTTLSGAGLKATSSTGSGNGTLTIASSNNTSFQLNAYGSSAVGGTVLGGAAKAGSTWAATTGVSDDLTLKIDGTSFTVNTGTVAATDDAGFLAALQAATTSGGKTLAQLGVTVGVSGGSGGHNGHFFLTSTAGSAHSIQAQASSLTTALGLDAVGTYTGKDAQAGFGVTGASFAGNTPGANLAAAPNVVSGGAYQVNGFTFSALKNGDDRQTITVTSVDPSGATQAQDITLTGGTGRNGRTIDEAVNSINKALQQSNIASLQSVTAVKYDDGSGNEKIGFLSATTNFNVTVGKDGSNTGIATNVPTSTVAATVQGNGSTANISQQQLAESVVTALANAVSVLGSAQATVGRGENQFNYAVNLAQSQLTNLATAESRIRDADLAAEAANLTKAQILMQAGVAALAQANSAPQQVLTLLRG